MLKGIVGIGVAVAAVAAWSAPAVAQVDPGVRGGPVGAGGPITSPISPLTTEEIYLFTEGARR